MDKDIFFKVNSWKGIILFVSHKLSHENTKITSIKYILHMENSRKEIIFYNLHLTIPVTVNFSYATYILVLY